MGWRTEPVTSERFGDFADVLNPSRRTMHCWCLSPRLSASEIDELGEGHRESAMRALCARDTPPGVITYRDEVPVEWAAANDAPAVEAYPVDPPGRMDSTMAYVGTRSMFEQAGFKVVGTTDAVSSRMPRIIVRTSLR